MTDRSEPSSAATRHPTRRPDIDAYLARFDWHPEPELIGYRDEAASREALRQLGGGHLGDRPRLPLRARRRSRDGRRRDATTTSDGASSGRPASRPAPPAPPTPAAAILDEFRTRLAGGQMNAQHPRQFGYFTPPPLPISIMGELLAQMTNQGVDVWHAGPVARVRRGGGRPLAVRPHRLRPGLVRPADVGWRHGQLHGHGDRPRPAPRSPARARTIRRAAAISRARGSTPATRRTSRSRGRSTSSASRPRRSSSSRPTTTSACAATPVAEAVERDRGRRPHAVRDRRGRRLDEHRVGRCRRRAGRRRRGRGAVAPRRRGLRRRRRACPRATPAACRTSIARTRSRSTRTSGSSRPTTSAGCWSATAGTSPRPSAVAAPSTTAAARRRPRREPTDASSDDAHDDHGDQLNFYKLSFEGTRRWRALKLWMSWKHLGTDGFGRLIEANDDLAAHLARRCAEADDFEALPEVPSLSVVCFRHLPGGRAAAMALPAGRARCPPGPAPARPSRCPATAG